MKILCKETNEVREWTLSEVLEEINRDHSDLWTPYDQNDWLDGWMEWVEGRFLSLVLEEGRAVPSHLKENDQ